MAFDPNNDEDMAAVRAIIEADMAPLKSKNAELIAELREARKGRNIDPAELERLESKVEELTGKLTASDKAIRDAQKAADTASKALEAETGFTRTLLAENGVVAALTAAGVTDPAFLEASKAMILPSVKIVADGDVRKALVGDKEVADHIKEWAASETGKRFVSAPANAGGGAQGGSGNGGNGKSISRGEFEAIADPAAKAEAARTMTITQ